MKVNRPPSFIPYGPLGHPSAQFMFKFEGPDLEVVTQQFCKFRPGSGENPPSLGTYAEAREELAGKGYFILPVADGIVPDEYMASLPIPPKYVPAAAGARGRRLEDFPYTVAGYYQHYTYEPFTNDSPECDHDFGLESAKHIFKVDGTGEVVPLKVARTQPCRPGQVYLTVQCTRCGDVHGIAQVTASGEVEL